MCDALDGFFCDAMLAPAQKRRKGSAVAMDVRARAADRGEVGVSALDAEAQLLHQLQAALPQKLVSLEEEEKVPPLHFLRPILLVVLAEQLH